MSKKKAKCFNGVGYGSLIYSFEDKSYSFIEPSFLLFSNVELRDIVFNENEHKNNVFTLRKDFNLDDNSLNEIYRKNEKFWFTFFEGEKGFKVKNIFLDKQSPKFKKEVESICLLAIEKSKQERYKLNLIVTSIFQQPEDYLTFLSDNKVIRDKILDVIPFGITKKDAKFYPYMLGEEVKNYEKTATYTISKNENCDCILTKLAQEQCEFNGDVGASNVDDFITWAQYAKIDNKFLVFDIIDEALIDNCKNRIDKNKRSIVTFTKNILRTKKEGCAFEFCNKFKHLLLSEIELSITLSDIEKDQIVITQWQNIDLENSFSDDFKQRIMFLFNYSESDFEKELFNRLQVFKNKNVGNISTFVFKQNNFYKILDSNIQNLKSLLSENDLNNLPQSNDAIYVWCRYLNIYDQIYITQIVDINKVTENISKDNPLKIYEQAQNLGIELLPQLKSKLKELYIYNSKNIPQFIKDNEDLLVSTEELRNWRQIRNRNIETIQKENEYRELLNYFRGMNFTYATQVSYYIKNNSLGYRFPHISGELPFEGFAEPMQGAIAPEYYRRLLKDLNLVSRGSGRKFGQFTSYASMRY